MEYFSMDNMYIYAHTSSIEFYIPMSYFDDKSKFAENKKDTINVLGVFDVGIFDNGKLIDMKVLNLPTWIEIFANNTEERDVKLPNDETATRCLVVTYNNGEKIMYSSVIEDSTNVESFYNFILKGKIPNIVPYEKSILILKKNLELNNVSLGVPDVVHELILSVSYRYKEDPSKKFAHVIGADPAISQYDYVMNNIRQICQYASTFTALTFEDIDSMVTTSLNRTRNNGQEAFSPIEDLLKM